MVNPQTAWQLIKRNAAKAKKTEMRWHSLKRDRRYRVVEVLDDRIIIQRKSGGKNQELTSARVRRAVDEFNERGCRVQRRSLISPTVAEETAFVLFHPELTWDDNNEFIIQINNL